MKALLPPAPMPANASRPRAEAVRASDNAHARDTGPSTVGATALQRQHHWSDIAVRAGATRHMELPHDQSQRWLKPMDDAGAADAGVGGVGDGGVPADAGVAAAPTLSVSGDSYNDNATESRKKIKFKVKVASADAKKYGLVNWVQGFIKDGSGKFLKAKLYGNVVDVNFAKSQVDSVDVDPLYWSDATNRWNYTTEADGFSATDDPGQAQSSEKGAEYALNFSIGLYKIADVAATTSGTLAATALQSIGWKYSVKVDAAGKFTHPAI